MTLQEILDTAIEPALALLPPKMSSDEARVLMLAIGLQESLFLHHRQMGNGPARGFWQFEKGGAVKGVMTHRATREYARSVCLDRGVSFETDAVWRALETDDVLAAAFARLNLWWCPGALPGVDDEDAAWKLYADVAWRPGKPHPETWPATHAAAREALGY